MIEACPSFFIVHPASWIMHPGLSHNFPVPDLHDPAGPPGILLVMRNHHNGMASGMEARENIEHVVAGPGVEISRGLIRQNEGRLVHESARDRNPLLFSAGELRRQSLILA